MITGSRAEDKFNVPLPRDEALTEQILRHIIRVYLLLRTALIREVLLS